MTDNEIIKVLECCVSEGSCNECPADKLGGRCTDKVNRMAIDLIKRKKAEIERLKENNNAIMRTMADAHTEAIKEFAKRVKGRAKAHYFDNCCYAVPIEEIDNLVKEMVGEGR